MSDPKAIETGTTTVGIIAKDAVVIAADSKSTIGYMVESKLARKVFQLDDHLGITVAGMVGDAQLIVRLLKAQFKLYKLERGPITVKAAATLLSNVLQGSKYFPYMNQFILAGYDTNGPAIYTFDPFGGYDTHDKFFSTGSGSPFVYGMLEANYREGMSADEAVALAVKAVRAAIERDIGSGGRQIIVAVIDKNGYRELSQADVKKYM
ncbi:MAG: archaeal proteasome endopeptidase complex subunit beta [Candidatus Aenigmatarchaeota archaeon]|nr:archaeal proteasome endopeptidase complex subunit beta [Candidatus Aenigmarchaeota archaeon]